MKALTLRLWLDNMGPWLLPFGSFSPKEFVLVLWLAQLVIWVLSEVGFYQSSNLRSVRLRRHRVDFCMYPLSPRASWVEKFPSEKRKRWGETFLSHSGRSAFPVPLCLFQKLAGFLQFIWCPRNVWTLCSFFKCLVPIPLFKWSHVSLSSCAHYNCLQKWWYINCCSVIWRSDSLSFDFFYSTWSTVYLSPATFMGSLKQYFLFKNKVKILRELQEIGVWCCLSCCCGELLLG